MNIATIPLLLTGLLLAGTSAPAQTALIAHRSHGGTARTFRAGRAGADNFGLPSQRLATEKIVWLRGTEVVRHGHWVSYHGNKKLNRPPQIDTLDLRRMGQPDLAAALKRLREEHPEAKFVGFDEQKMQAAWSGAN